MTEVLLCTGGRAKQNSPLKRGPPIVAACFPPPSPPAIALIRQWQCPRAPKWPV